MNNAIRLTPAGQGNLSKSKTQAIAVRFKKALTELRRKKNLADFLDFAVVSFGTNKKDYFLRLTKKPLAKNPVFSLEYIAVMDVFLLGSLVLWFNGYAAGLELALFIILVSVLVFVNEKQVDKKLRVIEKTTHTFLTTGKFKKRFSPKQDPFTPSERNNAEKGI